MKKLFSLFVVMFSLILSGCTIDYSSIVTPSVPEDDGQDDSTISTPSIEDNQLFYPSTLNAASSLITTYNYIDENLTDEYEIYSAYYSEIYDTIYIAYDLVDSPVQTLKAKDLYEIEKHALDYFESDANRSEDKDYLKAVRIYPDRLASSCRKGQSDEVANSINGCADYGGKEAIIDLNNTKSMDDFFNEKRVQIGIGRYQIHEPMRDTFAHEYGHISTFYHMVYKNDENYEDYLALRLGNYYDTVYPDGLPDNYSSSVGYKLQPEEILADDFVELFYKTDEKLASDTNEYTFEYTDYRNSLDGYDAQYLRQDTELKSQVKTYYMENFLNYSNKQTYETPIIISSTNNTINYYDSFSKITNESNLKTINSQIDVNIIAVGETTINNTKYYRVILSNTFKCPGNSCDLKAVGEKIGYVKASDYTTNTTLKLYKIDKGQKNSLFPIEDNDTNNLFVLPFYDFSYVLNTTNDDNFATMYDYLSNDLTNQTYRINIYSFGTLI